MGSELTSYKSPRSPWVELSSSARTIELDPVETWHALYFSSDPSFEKIFATSHLSQFFAGIMVQTWKFPAAAWSVELEPVLWSELWKKSRDAKVELT